MEHEIPTITITYHGTPGINDEYVSHMRSYLESYANGYNLGIKYLHVNPSSLYYLIHNTRLINLTIIECGLEDLPSELPNTIRKLELRKNKLTKLSELPSNLELLDCSENRIEWLDTLPDSLRVLICYNNPIQCITLSNLIFSNLQELDCARCNITDLTELPQGLLRLNCLGNVGLAKLPQIPATLEFLDCSLCILHELPEFPSDSKLKVLKCTDSGIKYLPLLPPKLEILKCHGNNLTYLPSPLPDTITELVCSCNYLISLPDTLPSDLVDLDCSSNKITKLPTSLSSLTKLDTLYCAANKLTWLPELPTSLCEIDCSNNNLCIFPMQIPSGLTWLDCRHNPMLQWLPAMPSELDYIRLYTVTLPLDESEDFAEITPEIITYINNEHARLFMKWLSDRLAVYKVELLERQLEITMNPDRISRLIQNGELGPLGTWYDSFG
jgi:hypothetical protein